MFEVEWNMHGELNKKKPHVAGGQRVGKEILETVRECTAIWKCWNEILPLFKGSDRNGISEILSSLPLTFNFIIYTSNNFYLPLFLSQTEEDKYHMISLTCGI